MPEKTDDLLLRARYLRARSKEVLARANVMKNAGARRRMRAIAVRYEKLAQRLERESGATTTPMAAGSRGQTGSK